MISQIQEVNFGPGTQNNYATLSNATVSLSEMGDRIITTQVKIDGDVVPDFDGWELRFRGERFVLNVKDPQAAKDNSNINSRVNLTFYSWATEQLKRYFMFTVPATATGVITADQYNASVSMNIQDFGTLLNQVLTFYFHGKITASVYQGTTSDIASVEVNYTRIWDLMQKIFEIYGVRWRIEYDSALDSYTVMIGYPALEITDHEFEYGFQGGLLRFERQVQSSDITNIMLGRGGTQNVPYRYFKKTDPQNPEWTADTDAIPELANLYMDRIRDAVFRWYIRGWVKNENRDTSGDEGYTLPDYDDADVPAAYLWAYRKGRYSDETFDPVEYVRDEESILKYGERWGHRDDDDDIYPTIQGINVGGARADLVVAVSEIATDDIHATTAAAADIVDLSNGVVNQTKNIEPDRTGTNLQYEEIHGDTFTVPTGMIATLAYNDFFITADAQRQALIKLDVVESESRVAVIRESDGEEISPSGLTAGTYRYIIYVAISNINGFAVRDATYGVNGLRLERSTAGSADEWKPTFDIWIRNVFDTSKLAGETPEEYSLRVWGPILGDRLGNEAAVAFSDGQMSISEDYDFKIASYPEFDQSKTLNGAQSEWKLTLRKTDAEFEATGLYVPNSTTGGKPLAGDHFYFLGIDMPQFYVERAEERVSDEKVLAFYGISDINPTWVVSLDQVRLDQEYNDEQERLFDKIEAGVKMFIYDRRFSNGATLALFANSVTFTWSDDTVILPSVEVVLSDTIAVTKSQIAEMRGDIRTLKSSVAQMSGVENLVRETIKPLFLGKTGEEQTSLSPTKFTSLVTSEDFKQGGLGGQGWGFYRDNTKEYQDLEEEEVAPVVRRTRKLRSTAAAPAAVSEEAPAEAVRATPSVRAGSQAVLEVDKLVVRREMHVNNLIVNQIAYVGGKQIISAAAIECVQVVEGGTYYDCYFDQKQGSVKNLFQVNDIALGQVFTADNVQLRFYKSVVTQVGVDYVRLSKTQKYGDGVPKKGDVIVQFGNTVDTDRQYAIIRDVIGGGYEQMLSDLDSIYNNGVEYYFAGLSTEVAEDGEEPGTVEPPKPRFFIGNADSYINYTASDGIIRQKGNIVQSPSGVEFPVPCWRGDYLEDEAYYYGDQVAYGGQSWIHIGVDATTGTDPAQGNIWRISAAKGESIYRLDLTNENAGINADAQGNILPGAARPDCTATLFYGSGAVSGAAYSISYPNNQGVQGVSINQSTGVMTFNAGSAGTPFSFSGNTLQITVTATVVVGGRTVTAHARMNVMKNVPGAAGADARTRWLVLSADKVSYNPNTPSAAAQPSQITAVAMQQIGENNPTTAQNVQIKWYHNDQSATVYSGPITVDKSKSTLYVELYDTTTEPYTKIDSESVPIIPSGLNGESAVVADLDNDMDAIGVGENGILDVAIPYASALVTNFRMVLGSAVQNLSNLTVSGVPTGVSYERTTTGSGSSQRYTGEVKFWMPNSGVDLTDGRYPITITGSCVISGATVTRSLIYTLMGVREGKDGETFMLVPSSNVIHKQYTYPNNVETVSITPASVSCVAKNSSGAALTGTYYIRYRIDGGSLTAYSSAVSTSNIEESLVFYLFLETPNAQGSNYIDIETIPLISDGRRGIQGAAGLKGKVMRGVNEFSQYGVKGDSTDIVDYEGLSDENGHSFYDMVISGSGSSRAYYYCDHAEYSGSKARTFTPGAGSAGASHCWVRANEFDFIATKVFLAQNAAIDVLSGNAIYMKNDVGNKVVAGIQGGTGVNFFAGTEISPTDTSQQQQTKINNANFRVDYEGNITAKGKIEASGDNFNEGTEQEPNYVAFQSNKGMRILGNSFFHGNIQSFSVVPVGESSAQSISSTDWTNSAQMSVGVNSWGSVASMESEGTTTSATVGTSSTGVARIASSDTDSDPHYVEIELYGGNATLKRGTSALSAPDENIISCPTGDHVKHFRVLSESDYNSLSTAEKNDLSILYFLT